MKAFLDHAEFRSFFFEGEPEDATKKPVDELKLNPIVDLRLDAMERVLVATELADSNEDCNRRWVPMPVGTASR